MSFSLTTTQVRARTKTVTRRLGWEKLRPGEHFRAIVKGMGLKKGEKVQRICELVCVTNTPEPLHALISRPEYGKAEATREGFPEMDGADFVHFFCKTHKRCTVNDSPNRIEFAYT